MGSGSAGNKSLVWTTEEEERAKAGDTPAITRGLKAELKLD